MTSRRPGDQPDPSAPGWKRLLGALSLGLCLLLWINGLIGSRERPSVGGSLERRQLELAALAAPALPPPLRVVLAGEDPLAGLRRDLETPGADPPAAEFSSTETWSKALLLLQGSQPERARPLLSDLRQHTTAGVSLPPDQERLALIDALLDLPQPPADPAAARRLAAAAGEPLAQRLACELLTADDAACRNPAAERNAVVRLLTLQVVPLLALLIGCGLLLRSLWLRWRGLRPAPSLPQAPPLSSLELVLLVAGGFAVVGSTLTPLALMPLFRSLLDGLVLPVARQEGLLVLGLYLGLMAGPLAILAVMLRGQPLPPPEGGWLQYRWRPLPTTLRRGLIGLLMVLPLVSLVGWLEQQLWGDQGGSNPLLELVLNGRDPLALLCFGFTALVLAPLFEETLFRGVVLPVVARDHGPIWGVIVSSGVFAVAHLSLGELPPLLVLGAGLGLVRLHSGRLGASVLMHGLWNALTFFNLVLLGT